MSSLDKARKIAVKEQRKQLAIINCTCFMALYEMSWDADKIIERFNDATEIWKECQKKEISTFELLEQETEIELALDGEKSWHDFDQFAHKGRVVSPEEHIYSIHRRTRWVAPMILGCMMIALSRIDKWDYDRLMEFSEITDRIRCECGEKVERYREMMEEKTGFTPSLWGQ